MPRRYPIKGDHKNRSGEREHAKGFQLALDAALKKWKAEEDPTTMDVRFQVDITPNPGGVQTYRAILSPPSS